MSAALNGHVPHRYPVTPGPERRETTRRAVYMMGPCPIRRDGFGRRRDDANSPYTNLPTTKSKPTVFTAIEINDAWARDALERGGVLTGKTSDARKAFPVATGVLDYFPDALLAVAECSMVGNEQQNPGSAMHWDRSKSTGHANCLVRHLIQRGTKDTDGIRHSTKVAWRALALLQVEIEKGYNQ